MVSLILIIIKLFRKIEIECDHLIRLFYVYLFIFLFNTTTLILNYYIY